MNKTLYVFLVLFTLCWSCGWAWSSVMPHARLSGIWAYGDTVTTAEVLDTRQNNLRFYCTTVENLPSDSLEFEFLLEGYASEWHPAFSGGWYFYTDLRPGNYVFSARCRYRGGEWGPVCSHSFVIACPWWITWWAYGFYVFAVCAVLVFIFHLIRERVRLYNQLKVEQAASRFKADFVIQASRKLRTPLTVIRTTTEKLTSRQDSLTRTDIQHLRNSSKQLMQMLENLLEYRQIDEVGIVSNVTDVIEMADVPLNNRLVFVVEPDKILADVIRRELLKYMKVRLYSTGRDVVRDVQQMKPDLIVIDTELMDMNAYALLSEIKDLLWLPVILVSDFDNKQSLIRAIHSKADDYLSKPFNCEVLSALVLRHIKLYEASKDKAVELVGDMSEGKVPETLPVIIEKRTDKRFLEVLDATITENMSDCTFDVNSLAEVMKISRSQLGNKVKRLRGMTCVEYLRACRLSRAAQLLTAENLTVSEVMYKVGMQDITNFYRRFKEKYGVSPAFYRQYVGLKE